MDTMRLDNIKSLNPYNYMPWTFNHVKQTMKHRADIVWNATYQNTVLPDIVYIEILCQGDDDL